MDVPSIDIDSGTLDNGATISHGSAAILAKLSEISTQRTRPIFEHYLINIAMIIRNCISSFKTEKPKDILELIRIEMAMYNLYISQYCRPDTDKQITVDIAYYFPSYATVPMEYLKTLTKSELTTNTIQKAIHKHFFKNSERYENVRLHTFTVGDRRLPHIELMKELKQIDPTTEFRRTVMISHMPVDYHYSTLVPKYTLLRSHTAEFVTREKFGKMVFKYDLPFNRYTHLLYGDSKLIKAVLSTAQKKKIADIAEQKKWKYKSESAIHSYIVQTALVPSSYLSKAPF